MEGFNMNSLTKEVLQIVRDFIREENISMSEFAKMADVSKAWLSKLQYTDANISIEMANRLLDAAGYRIIIKDNFNRKGRLKRNNLVIACQNIQ